MRRMDRVGLFLFVLALFFPGLVLHGEEAPAGTVQQESEVGGALAKARDSLRDAMEALAEAGRLTLDQQLPKLKEQTDQTLKSTQNLLDEWEEQLKQELKRDPDKKGPELPSSPPTGEPKERAFSPSI